MSAVPTFDRDPTLAELFIRFVHERPGPPVSAKQLYAEHMERVDTICTAQGIAAKTLHLALKATFERANDLHFPMLNAAQLLNGRKLNNTGGHTLYYFENPQSSPVDEALAAMPASCFRPR